MYFTDEAVENVTRDGDNVIAAVVHDQNHSRSSRGRLGTQRCRRGDVAPVLLLLRLERLEDVLGVDSLEVVQKLVELGDIPVQNVVH